MSKIYCKNETYSATFNSLPNNDKNWILDYLCGGKGVIPYEKIKTHQDLESVLKNDSFSKTEFNSSLKNEVIDDESYENVKKFWKTLHLKKLSGLNNIYNFQDTIILCKIFENRAREFMQKFLYNP